MNDLNSLSRQEVELIIHVLGVNYDYGDPIHQLLDKIKAYYDHRVKMNNPTGVGGWGGSDASWVLEPHERAPENTYKPKDIAIDIGSGHGGGSDTPLNQGGGQGASISPFGVKIKYVSDESSEFMKHGGGGASIYPECRIEGGWPETITVKVGVDDESE